MNFSTTYADLPSSFYKVSKPARFSAPRLLAFNERLSDELGFSHTDRSREDLAAIFSGQQVLEGSSFLSMAYAAHQFGHFVPQLGDGRATLLGEVIDVHGHRRDVQLKGAGPTFYSRNGDGFSALGPVIREYLVSEAMHRLGVPTTRALAAVWTGDRVYREGALPGGVFTRVAASHLRIGTFQFFAARRDHESLETLLHYAVDRHFPALKGQEDLPLRFLEQVGKVQTELVAHWMSLGFIHGVMNTDNTTISGETIDYGPCAFMDQFRSDQVFSYIDSHGRYAYSNQKEIVFWNLARLADCMIPLMGPNEEASIEALNAILEGLPQAFDEAYLKKMMPKFGIEPESSHREKDLELIASFLELMEREKRDHTNAFRSLEPFLVGKGEALPWWKGSEGRGFEKQWLARLQGSSHEASRSLMAKHNPIYIPRNHQVERVIEHAEEGDFEPLETLLSVLEEPFLKRPGLEPFERPPQPKEVVLNTFCGT